MVVWGSLYLLLAGVVVFLSIKLADYVDLIDKKTNISGAFIGGVVLAAVTSLPELFTSISAVTIVNQPNMVLGNILGSNLFNVTIIGFLIMFMTKKFLHSTVGKSHLKSALFTLVLFGLMFFAVYLGFDFSVLNISIYSIVIIGIYAISVRFMAGDDASEGSEDTSKLSLKTIILLFALTAIFLVLASIGITYVTDKLAAELNLGATLAGALFLGIATSLPELTSCMALAKKGNFNACMGNVLGSGLFNFLILAISDLIYRGGSMYKGDSQSKTLVLFCLISMILVIATLVKKFSQKKENNANNIVYKILGIGIIICYVLFIVLS